MAFNALRLGLTNLFLGLKLVWCVGLRFWRIGFTAGFRISVPVECTGLPSQTKILTHV